MLHEIASVNRQGLPRGDSAGHGRDCRHRLRSLAKHRGETIRMVSAIAASVILTGGPPAQSGYLALKQARVTPHGTRHAIPPASMICIRRHPETIIAGIVSRMDDYEHVITWRNSAVRRLVTWIWPRAGQGSGVKSPHDAPHMASHAASASLTGESRRGRMTDLHRLSPCLRELSVWTEDK